MTFLIEHMLDEMDGAEAYYKMACDTEDPMTKRTLKETALGEISNFDKLAALYQQKLAAEAAIHDTTGNAMISDVWFKYFKHKADALKQKISTL